MDELRRLEEQAEELEARVTAELPPPDAAPAVDDDTLLHERKNAYYQLSGAFFRACSFAKAARYYRLRHANTRAYEDWYRERNDEDGAAFEREELARYAWAVGDMELFERYVREGCDPQEGLRPRLDVHPALFLSWAVLRKRFHPHHWIRGFREAEEAERVQVRRSWAGEARAVAEAVAVDAKVARALYWLGDFDDALSHARLAARGFESFGRSRPAGLSVTDRRARLQRTEGLVALLEGRAEPSRLESASSHFRRGLEASAFTHGQDWKDLVLLLATAEAWSGDRSGLNAALAEHFPQLVHVTARRREWVGSEN